VKRHEHLSSSGDGSDRICIAAAATEKQSAS
jgi:hypothetical protein